MSIKKCKTKIQFNQRAENENNNHYNYCLFFRIMTHINILVTLLIPLHYYDIDNYFITITNVNTVTTIINNNNITNNGNNDDTLLTVLLFVGFFIL